MDIPGERHGSDRGGVRRWAALVALPVGAYASAVAVRRVVDLDGAWRLIDPSGPLDPVISWGQLLGLVAPGLGALLFLAALLALGVHRRWSAVTFAVVAVTDLLAWIAYLTLLLVAERRFGGVVETYWTSEGRWPYDAVTMTALPLLALVLAVASLRRGATSPTPTAQETTEPEPAPASDSPWFVQIGGTEYGPYRWAQVQEFAREGRVRGETAVRPADGPWRSASGVPDLIP
ncbi:DUF4339 domain-containing protein [Aeromicrobium alkaliterrae]|uniref:GYF domain-containing protein n=1 Tax=Aeromicrobium alkaliterrae TaxID=302168 RepID=A0ABN2KCT2_9ACTN